MGRTGEQICEAVRQNLFNGDPSAEALARVEEFVQAAQREAEDAYVSPAQRTSFTATANDILGTLVGTLATLAPSWVGVRIDRAANPVVAPYYLDAATGKPAGYLDFTEDVARARALYGTAGIMAKGKPELLVLDRTGGDGITGLFLLYPEREEDYDILVPYWRRLTPLTDASSGDGTNWFSEHADNYLEWRATMWGLLFNRDYGGAGTYATLAAGELNRITARSREAHRPDVASIRQRGYSIGQRAGSRYRRDL